MLNKHIAAKFVKALTSDSDIYALGNRYPIHPILEESIEAKTKKIEITIVAALFVFSEVYDIIKIDTKLEKNILKMLKISLLNKSSPENSIFDLFKNKKKIINDVQKVTKVYRQYKSVKENNLA